ncbi:MAG: AraC family transcriptional regulator [Alistipes sp.]
MLYETILPIAGSSFTKKNFIFKHFPPDWHYHAEYELVAITEGFGKRFVGSGVSEFAPGDIVLIGSNVPHFHLSDISYYDDNDLYCCSEVIQFNLNIFPADFRAMPEFEPIAGLLDLSARGLLFHNAEVLESIRAKLSDFERLDGLKRLMKLYSILGVLSQTSNYSFLSITDQVGYSRLKDIDNRPVYRAYQFLANNFKEIITLQQVAKYAGQNPTALCRNFKQSTGLSIFNCLSEIRIDFAYKLLINSNFSIMQTAYESGFRNISHFNHKFREISGLSPQEYRKTHQAEAGNIDLEEA